MLVKYSFYFIGLLVLFTACENNEQDKVILSSINETLEASAKSINNETEGFYKTLEERLSDPKTTELSRIWQPKAESIHKLSSDLFYYIYKLKGDLKETITPDQASGLHKKLNNYKKEILLIDSEMISHFKDSKSLELLLDSSITNSNDFYTIFFKNTSTTSNLTVLSKIQNNIRITENELSRFCVYRTTYCCGMRIPKYGVLIGQNTLHLKKGETLEISAAIGSFSLDAAPKINIDSKLILAIDGRANYKLKVSKNTGKHYIPVSVEYTDQNGMKQTETTDVEYTVDE